MMSGIVISEYQFFLWVHILVHIHQPINAILNIHKLAQVLHGCIDKSELTTHEALMRATLIKTDLCELNKRTAGNQSA